MARLALICAVDFDCHHGNGTEELLRDDPDYFFASIHAVGEHFYPGTGKASSTAPNVLSTTFHACNFF